MILQGAEESVPDANDLEDIRPATDASSRCLRKKPGT